MQISLITTTFNDSKTITSLLQTINQQTFLPKEFVIIDGGSKDDTVAVIEQYAKSQAKYQIRVVSDGIRRNISEGFNKGIEESKNDWVLIMASGNSYENDFIEIIANATTKSSSTKVFYSSVVGAKLTKFGHVFNQYFLKGNKLHDFGASNHGMLIHKSVTDRIGLFWENFFYAGEDTEYALRIQRNNISSEWVVKAVARWDTPQTTKEYLKKMRVNAIADWQIFSANKILLIDIIQIMILLMFVALCIYTLYFLLLLIPLLIIVSWKKKTNNLLSILLGLSNRFVMTYYHFLNRKYAKKRYHVPYNY